jgi:hypothetical protein
MAPSENTIDEGAIDVFELGEPRPIQDLQLWADRSCLYVLTLKLDQSQKQRRYPV